MNWDVIVVGAGAAGLVAAERSAARGRRTLLLEKNPRPGVKILMSGGKRCNLTQATDNRGIVTAFGRQGHFLHSALAQLSPQDLIALVEGEGVSTKVESTGKVFPVSNLAGDVLAAFVARLGRTQCEIALGEPLIDINRSSDSFTLITSKRTLSAEKVIVTTGGKSYPRSGTSGDAYNWASKFGHTVVTPHPALTPITSNSSWVRDLMGITLSDVALALIESHPAGQKPRPINVQRGSLLFTHFGLSGPVALDLSRSVSLHSNPRSLSLLVDFLPQLPDAQAGDQLRNWIANAGGRQLVAAFADVLPRRVIESLMRQIEIDPTERAAELLRAKRDALLNALKRFPIAVSGTLGFAKAEVTAGGVSLSEVNSATMESKLVPNLYWAGEVLDLDGPIGGYNFQAAFATGWLAGLHV